MEQKTLKYWQDKAASLSIEGRAFIDGAYRDATSGKTFDCMNPADGSLLAKATDSDEADVNAAAHAARPAATCGCRKRRRRESRSATRRASMFRARRIASNGSLKRSIKRAA